jgi:hypothetical protein
MITVVSGVPRSGTSLMMQMLAAGGLTPLVDGQRAADASNPRGYFEWQKAKSLPREPDCIAEAEGKVVKVISTLLLSLPNTFAYKVIFVERPLSEVVASQSAMVQKLGTEGPALGPEAMERALEAHLKHAKASLRLRPEMSLCWVAYHDALQNPQGVSETIEQFLGVPLSLPSMTAQVDLSLYRQRQPGSTAPRASSVLSQKIADEFPHCGGRQRSPVSGEIS